MASISSNYPTRSEISEEYQAAQSKKEEIRTQNESEIENLKKSYELQKEDLKDRYESSSQAERARTYENLRNLKSQLNREERQMDALKNQELNQKKTNFVREEVETTREGTSRINDIKSKYVETEAIERQKLQNAENQIRTDHKHSAETILNNSAKKVEDLRVEKENFLENKKLTHGEALSQIENHYNGLRDETEKNYEQGVQNVRERAIQDLNQRKLAQAELFNKHAEKQNDPFYQMTRFDSDLLDVGGAYLLRVKVPEYERKQFRVQVSGQEIQLSGVRSTDQTVQIEPGRSISTKAYQNVSERYRLDAPVDGRSLTFKEAGEWVEYTLPKFGPGHRMSDQSRHQAKYEESQIGSPELEFINTLPKPKTPGIA